MKASKILEMVHEEIKHRRSFYICFALGRLSDRGEIPVRDYRRVQLHIYKMLDGATSYEAWLLAHHPKVFNRMRGFKNGALPGRLAWIDHMIAEFKKQGD